MHPKFVRSTLRKLCVIVGFPWIMLLYCNSVALAEGSVAAILSRTHCDRNVATGVQLGKTEEVTRRADARPICKTVDQQGRYNAGRL